MNNEVSTKVVTIEEVYAALSSVTDPEIPTISVVDLGVITKVEIPTDNVVNVTMTPTFIGCPAIEVMRKDTEQAVRALGVKTVNVRVSFEVPWSSNRVTEKGREALHRHGLATPSRFEEETEVDILLNAECPVCASTNTELRSPFGPTLCRAIYYCHSCLQAFEQFKAI